jgi:hypothetical protein
MLNFRLYYARWSKYFSRHQPKRVRTLRPTLECLEDRCVPTTYTVTYTYTLREAILASNAHPGTNGPNLINFNLDGSNVIQPIAALPTITSPVVIDGDANKFGFEGIVLDGQFAAGSPAGLTIAANGCTIEGLTFNDWGAGLVVEGNDNTIGGTAQWSNTFAYNRYSGIVIDNGSGNMVEGNEIGFDPSGDFGANGNDGVKIEGPLATNNIIGGPAPGDGNEITENGSNGVGIIDGASNNYVEGNSIGITTVGFYVYGNVGDGVYIGTGANNNYIGAVVPAGEGKLTAVGNVITGNLKYGVEITGADTDLNYVVGNDIGTVEGGGYGTGPQGSNELGGVLIHGGASDNWVGATEPVSGNVISGNDGDGVIISGKTTTGNFVVENRIGVNSSDVVALPNRGPGVFIEAGANGNTIGLPGGDQIIAGNTQEGVLISDAGTTGNMIEGNQIGTTAVPNAFSGVAIDVGATGNTVGGTAANDGNTITGNKGDGVNIQEHGTDTNTVEGNVITGNLGQGVIVQAGAADNTVGTASAPNVISGNANNGVVLLGAHTKGNQVEYNLIGLNAAGDVALANGTDGVSIAAGASDNQVGYNFIAGNATVGVRIAGVGTKGNDVFGNSIGVAEDGSAVANLYGVYIETGASDNTIGTTPGGSFGGNIVANNTHAGVAITGDTSIGNTISQNSIFANGGLGIDLGNTGMPTTNTNTGPNVGPNQLQNYPVLTGITGIGGMAVVSGTLNSTPGSSFTIEFFLSPTSTPGQGKIYLGSVPVSDASGDNVFTFPFTPSVANPYLTATATDINGNTSEFSVPLPVPLISTSGNLGSGAAAGSIGVGSAIGNNASLSAVLAGLAAEYEVNTVSIPPATANSYQVTVAVKEPDGESVIVYSTDVVAEDVISTNLESQTSTGKIFQTLA